MCDHVWTEEYYGARCTKCDLFYPHGCAPWESPEAPEWEEWGDAHR